MLLGSQFRFALPEYNQLVLMEQHLHFNYSNIKHGKETQLGKFEGISLTKIFLSATVAVVNEMGVIREH